MDQPSIKSAIKQICDEKNISYESVIETIEAALAAAYRKDFGNKLQNIKVKFNPDTGQIKVFDVKVVVEDIPPEELEPKQENFDEQAKPPLKQEPTQEGQAQDKEKKRFNPKTEIQFTDAQKIKESYKIGDEIITELPVPGAFGRMAAQTAKQVITQKLREAERETLFNEFKQREGEIMIGTVQRREGPNLLVDLGKLTALLPLDEQISRENYAPSERFKVYILSVNKTTKGPEVIVSRSHPEIVKRLFATEIPEIANGTVVVKGIAREAGSRTKIAVYTDEDNIDPIGSCIGQRGSRVQTIISELKGEKVDIIEYNDDPEEYIMNALSPARILELQLNKEEKSVKAVVSEDQLSLAIGKAGQNVRLAAKLTGWRIDIITQKDKAMPAPTEVALEKPNIEEKSPVEVKDSVETKKEKVEKKEEEPKKEKKSTAKKKKSKER